MGLVEKERKMPGKPSRKHRYSVYENTCVGENEMRKNPNMIHNQLINQKREIKSSGSFENVDKGVKQDRFLLETDFPVVELKSTAPFKKSSIPSEQIKLNWLQNISKHAKYFINIINIMHIINIAFKDSKHQPRRTKSLMLYKQKKTPNHTKGKY